MTTKKEPTTDLTKAAVAKLPSQPSGTKMMHAVVMSAGPGARLLELTRSGSARKGIEAWVEREPVVWLSTDRSALMPVTSGQPLVTFRVSGQPSRTWDIRVSKPDGATGGSNDTLPAAESQPVIGVFTIDLP